MIDISEGETTSNHVQRLTMSNTSPNPLPGAEVISIDIDDILIDGSGAAKFNIEDYAVDVDGSEDIIFNDTGTLPLTLVEISKLGGDSDGADVVRFDLSTFDDDFTITLGDVSDDDQLFLIGVHSYTDNGDGTSTATYYGSDAILHTVTIEPDNASIETFYAPDGIVDGAEGAEVMDVGYTDFQDDEIDGADGVNDTIFGNGGSDTITGGAGDDTIFGDFDIGAAGKPTSDLPPNAYFGTPDGPAAGAEIDTVTLTNSMIDDGDGSATITVDDFADPDNQNDLTINDGGTEALTDLLIEKGGDSDDPDVYRLDLSGFNDDFALELKNVDTTDKIVLTNVFTIEDNLDDTHTITYYGSDSELHTITLTPDVAQIEAYVTADSPYFFDDIINGGAGEDIIDGGYGDDTIDAGDDNDSVEGGVGDDDIMGGAGAGTIYGGDGSDIIDGGSGDDIIKGDREGQAEGLVDTIEYSYAQTIDGDEAAHFGEQGQGTANDPLNIIDRDIDTEVRFHENDFFEYAFGQEVVAGTSITLTEGPNGVDDEVVRIYVSMGSTDPAGDSNSGSGGGVGYENAVTNGQSVLVYEGPSDATVAFDVPIDATHIQFLGAGGDHGGWAEIEFTDVLNPLVPGVDIITGGDGDDAIDSGAGDDTIDGGADSDTIDGGTGNDDIIGGGGNDALYGGDGEPDIPLERIAFKWSDLPDPDDGGQIDSGDDLTGGSQTASGVQIDYNVSKNNATFDATATATAGVDAGSGTVNPNSSISFDNDVTVDLNFSEAVTNVSFRISDFENNAESIVIRAYDIDGNLIPFTSTIGANMASSDTDAVPGDDTFSGAGPELGDTNLDNSMLVEIAGPVARIELEMTSTGGSLSASDIYFDDPATGLYTVGNDEIDAGTGDDTIIAGLGTDNISGGSGADSYDASISPNLAEGSINVTVNNLGDATVAKSVDGNTDTVTSVETYTAGEAAGQTDSITLTDAIKYWDLATELEGLDDSAVGTFTPDWGGASVAFGGSGEPTLSEVLSGTFDLGGGITSPTGTFQITSGDESGRVGDITFSNFEEINFQVVCFSSGTHIMTGEGEVEVQNLKVGDVVLTADNVSKPIAWIGSRELSASDLRRAPSLRPIRIRAGALGNGKPKADLIVSPQHRILVKSKIALRMFDNSEVLIAAKHLLGIDGIDVMENATGVTYWHFAFDQHEIVFAEGALAETFYPGPEALKTVSAGARRELITLFPELEAPDLCSNPTCARPFVNARRAQRLVDRTNKNAANLFQEWTTASVCPSTDLLRISE
ncbi:Hint domain-containing protein [Ruegeria hyattellae]|uniref:Hint domain-containing protein n=1 Tax=Ruegeria hyattellae TaxID=3233337 RepID=UPI00355C63E0